MSNFGVSPLPTTTLAGLPEQPPYEVAIAALGYEARARRIPLAIAPITGNKHALAFGTPGVADYDVNATQLDAAGYECAQVDVGGIVAWVQNAVDIPGASPLRCAFDLSSLTRDRIAAVIEGLVTSRSRRTIEVDILYAPAAWVSAPADPLITEVLGPVSPFFAGWSTGPDRPVVSIVGLGYEPYRALGALEYLEPDDVWCFVPRGSDGRYDRATAEANRALLRNLDPHHVLTYQVLDPFDCYAQLERVTYAVSRHARPVLVPLGPKLFAFCCLLVGLRHRPEASVWRVTPGTFADKQNRDAAGAVVGLHVTLPARRPQSD